MYKRQISIDSEVDKGTTVNVYFPVADVNYEVTKREHHAEVEEFQFSGRVLICEDDTNVRNYLVDLLNTTDFDIVSVDNPLDAVEHYEKDSVFDLLITDIIMPGMNGKELSDKLNEIRPVPSIFVSGYSENVFSDKGIITDDITFIQKPFTKEKLFKAINDTLTDV